MRVRRWLFNLAAAVSVLLCVATCVLWVRSYFIADTLAATAWRDDRQCATDAIYSIKGVVVLYQFTTPLGQVPTTADSGLQWVHQPASRMKSQPLSLPFWIALGDGKTPLRWRVRFSYWLILLLTALSPAVWIWRRIRVVRRRRRIERGCCPSCGYDLRASPDRCPECGAEPGVLQGKMAT
jgi:hypothetical protein